MVFQRTDAQEADHAPEHGSARQCWRRTGQALAPYLAVLYILLLPGNLLLRAPLYWHDLLAPLMVICLLATVSPLTAARENKLLVGFLALCVLTTFLHLHSRADLYELGIFLYMGLLYLFYRYVYISKRLLAAMGCGILVSMFLYFMIQAVSGRASVYEVYEGTSLGFIAKRFFFTFEHPNLAGSFYCLPLALALLALDDRGCVMSGRRPFTLAAAAAMVIVLVPLPLTVSRHMLISGCLILGAVVWRLEQRYPSRLWLLLALLPVGVVFTVFWLTILFPFFPLRDSWPFANTDTLGMYMIHQCIYARIATLDPAALLLGVGRSEVFRLYPLLADWDTAHAILSQYDQAFLTPGFTTYMDAHNEYLNLATAFGVPAVAAGYGFWFRTGGRLGRRGLAGRLLLFLVLAVALASFWDDILSKRWMWVAFGVLAGHAARAGERGQQAGRGPAAGDDRHDN